MHAEPLSIADQPCGHRRFRTLLKSWQRQRMIRLDDATAFRTVIARANPAA